LRTISFSAKKENKEQMVRQEQCGSNWIKTGKQLEKKPRSGPFLLHASPMRRIQRKTNFRFFRPLSGSINKKPGTLHKSLELFKGGPMIDREKTIAKALLKYHSIFPVYGKKTLQECFICVRGEWLFLFRTGDKKKLMVKAELFRPSVSFETINRELLSSVYSKLNQPILVRSLFVKNGDSSRPALPADYINGNFFSSLYKTLNQPISLRAQSVEKNRLPGEAPQIPQRRRPERERPQVRSL
jgi:hypothetical protein